MRELKGEKDLQLAKDLLKAFENQHAHRPEACSDIQEGLYWDNEAQCYSADLGFLLRGEAEEIRIFEADEDWLEFGHSRPVAYLLYGGKMYFFALRF